MAKVLLHLLCNFVVTIEVTGVSFSSLNVSSPEDVIPQIVCYIDQSENLSQEIF